MQRSFWKWFATQHLFSKIVEGGKISRLISWINPSAFNSRHWIHGSYALTGMYNEPVELIHTPEGDIKVLYLQEDLVAATPAMNGWRFTALKPATGPSDTCIGWKDIHSIKPLLRFYSTELEDYPDEIDITLVHTDLNKTMKNWSLMVYWSSWTMH